MPARPATRPLPTPLPPTCWRLRSPQGTGRMPNLHCSTPCTRTTLPRLGSLHSNSRGAPPAAPPSHLASPCRSHQHAADGKLSSRQSRVRTTTGPPRHARSVSAGRRARAARLGKPVNPHTDGALLKLCVVQFLASGIDVGLAGQPYRAETPADRQQRRAWDGEGS